MHKLFYNGPSFDALIEQYAKQGRIDDAAPIIASQDIEINAPADIVWEIVADIAGYPSLDPAFSDVKVSDIKVGAPLSLKIKGAPIRATLAVIEPNKELTWVGKSFWTKAVDRHIIEPLDNNRTRLRMDESLAGVLVPLFFSAERLKQQHRAWLSGVKRSAENT